MPDKDAAIGGMVLDDGSSVTTIKNDGHSVWEYGIQEVTNTEPGAQAKTVRTFNKTNMPDARSGEESACMYFKVAGNAASRNVNGLYIDVDSTNSEQTTGIKIIHNGDNDAVYIAGFSTAAALETATFANGSTGVISTCQWEGEETGDRDFGNSTLFNAVWGDDGTGGSETPANYGMFYASRSLGHSFRTQLQDPTATGWAWGRVEMAVSSYDLATNHFELTSHGQLTVEGRVADSGTTEPNDARLKVVNSYWNGASADKYSSYFLLDANAGTPYLSFFLGTEDSETERMRLANDGSLLVGGDQIQIAQSQTPSASNSAGDPGAIAWDSDYIYVHVGSSTWKRAAIATW